MTKAELKAELIARLNWCEVIMQNCEECTDERIYGEGRKSGLKLALQLLEHLRED